MGILRQIFQPAQNTTHIGAAGGRSSQPTVPASATTNRTANTHNPLLGRPIWTYVETAAGPVRGPQPRLARGSGHTGDSALPGNSAMLPGYLSDNEYFPTLNAYDSVNQPKFSRNLPKSIADGTNGREMVGTYQPHDFTPGTRQLNHLRQAAAWQVQEFPPDFRNLLSWQQVQKYRVLSMTAQARPLSSADYFLGYQINPDISAKIGQTTMGVMGSM